MFDQTSPERAKQYFWLASIAFIVIVAIKVLSIGSRPKDLPPGPPTLPVIGNLHQLPKKNIHLDYQKWAKKYGPIFSLKLGDSTTVVLADGYVIRELVDLRGGNYAHRPNLWVRELFDDSRIIMRGYDDLWKLERKMYHASLNINVAKQYLPYQELEFLQLIHDTIQSPENFVEHIGRATGSFAASMTYGFRLPNKDSDLTHEMLHNSHGFFTCVAKSQIFDYYPALRNILKLFPRSWNPLAKEALAAYESERNVFAKSWKAAQKGSLPCFAKDIAKAREKAAASGDIGLFTEHAAQYIAGISFEGGADTTRYTLHGFIKAMTMYPEALKKGQAEIDSICDEGTFPMGLHIKDFRYINQMAKENVRWMPTAINGAIPHAALKEDHYRGHRIPQGANIVLAVWSANNDEKDFPNARDFLPERHPADTSLFESATSPNPKDRGQWGFGSGRRMCPGMHVASNTLLLAIARILWAFDITYAKDEAGNDIFIDRDAMVGGLAAAPAPFRCSITPRSKGRVELVEKEWKKARDTLLHADGNYKGNLLSR